MDNAHAAPIECPVCHGAGCTACNHLGIAAERDGWWWVWRHPITARTIREHTITRVVNALLTLFVAAFGVAGIALLFWALRANDVTHRAPWAILAEQRGDWRLTLFGVSVVLDVYLAYRVRRASSRIGTLPRGDHGHHAPAITSVRDARKHPHRDLATVMTPTAVYALEVAWRLAYRFEAPAVLPVHLFAALLDRSTIAAVRARLGVDDARLATLLQQAFVAAVQPAQVSPPLSGDLRRTLLGAYDRARTRRAAQIDVLDLFAATAERDDTVRTILDELAITPSIVENVVLWIATQEDFRRQWRYVRSRARFKPKGAMDRAMTAVATPLLDRFSTDLTLAARAGMFLPCVARDRELAQLLRMLEGGRHPLLVGSAGVGKHALLQGLAQRMVTEDVPAALRDKRFVLLSIPALVGAGNLLGGVEGRLERILLEIARARNIVLALPDAHELVGISSLGGASLDLSALVAAALHDRQFLAVGTTTTADFRRIVEPSGALAAAFTPLPIAEPDHDDAIKMLEAHAARVEYQHHVYFSYAAIDRIVRLTQRYLHDQPLPSAGIALMEETAASRHGTRAVITAENVAALVAEKTNIPVADVTATERAQLLSLEARLHERIVGQDEAVRAVSAALRRARTELRDAKRPIAAFLFLGPTGVGKTELAKTLARVYFGSEQSMVRLDMSEYQEPSSISRLLGAAPGYAGSTEGGYLTDAVRRRPFSLILLDELEKAHPDILNVFLQVFDDGRLTDSSGRTVDFTNAIIIATSNAGTAAISEHLARQMTVADIRDQLVDQELGRYFRPEFLNRFDQIIVFTPLSPTDVVAVTKLLINDVTARLAEKGIAFEASEAAIRELAQLGYDPRFGARPLRRLVQERVDTALANFLLTGALGRRDRAILEPGGSIRVEPAPSILQRTATAASTDNT